MAEKILGIDLGTTNSVAALVEGGVPRLIPVGGERLLPSVVGRTAEGELLVGVAARNQWVAAPERTIRSIKRKMGSGELVEMAGATYSPQEISALILRELKAAAESHLGEEVRRAVITVPAYFSEPQRQATIEAGEIAGLEVERIINEPTAAALAYGLGRDEEARVLVYDLGGGTFDVSIIELNAGVVDVRATAGDNHLGGDDFDERLAAWLADEFEAEHAISLRNEPRRWARLLRAAEEAKIALSSSPYTLVALEYLAEDDEGRPLHLSREVERAEFESLIDDQLDRTIELIEEALGEAELRPEEIDRVLLVGGSTRIPAVWERVAERMGQEPHLEIDPDAAVALGAAVQAAIVAGVEIDAILVDVTPHSLGIETARHGYTGALLGDQFTPLIRRNTTIPVERSELFTTLYPGQPSIHIKVYQGEEPIASRNVLLGDFMVEKLSPDRRGGLAEVLVNFRLDVNGILDVTVTERQSGKRTGERLKASRARLSAQEIAASQQRLAADAEGASELLADPGTHALLERAAQALARPDLDPELADELRESVAAIRAAILTGDDGEVEAQCDALIDLLFDAEA